MKKEQIKKIAKSTYKFLKKGLKVFVLVLLISFIAQKIGILEPSQAHAQTLSSNEKTAIPALVIAFENLLNNLLWPVLLMIGGLLDNSILFGSGMEERMREIWIPIRNLVNIMFVVALVGIALYNVTGLAEDGGNASIKTALPKLLIGIILVNFSFLGIKVFLDVVNVGTVSIMSLPDQVSEGLAEIDVAGDEEAVRRICLSMAGKKSTDPEWNSAQLLIDSEEESISRNVGQLMKIDVKGLTAVEIKKSIKDAKLEENFDKEVEREKSNRICSGFELTPTGEKFLANYGESNAAFALAINMGEIMYYQDLKLDIDNIEGILTSMLFSMLLYIIYAAAFLALFVVLLGRLVVLWLSIVLSPVLMIAIFVPQIKEKISVFNSISEKFIKNAIAPIGISLSLTIGWIMLKSMKFSETIGMQSPLSDILSGKNGSLPVVGLNTLQDFIVGIGTVAVVWMGVFTAASDTIAQGITDSLKNGLLSAGKWIARKPLDMPLVPLHLTEDDNDKNFKASANELGAAFRDIFSPKSSNGLVDKLKGEKTPSVNIINQANSASQLARIVENTKDSTAQFIKGFKELKSNDTQAYRDYIQNTAINDALNKLLKEGNTPEQNEAAKKELLEANRSFARSKDIEIKPFLIGEEFTPII